MSLNYELVIFVIINFASVCIAIGYYLQTIKYLEGYVSRIEEEKEKHNLLRERVVALEEKVKSAHHRVTVIEEQYLVEKRKWY